jgi:hypothetical protein
VEESGMTEITDTRSLALYIEQNGLDVFFRAEYGHDTACEFRLQDIGFRLLVSNAAEGLYAVTKYRVLSGTSLASKTGVMDTVDLVDMLRQLLVQHHRAQLPNHAFVPEKS